MASVNQDQQPFNLASRMELPNPVSLNDMKGIFASQNVDLDARDERGWSPLMIACGKNKKKMVQFLLDHGADPNAKGSKDGNTPMHFASIGNNCTKLPPLDYFYSRQGWDMQSRKEILGLLINHGATLTCNLNGLDPPCMAAIYNFQDIVEFFVQGKTHELRLSNAEKARVYEILGVAVGLNANLNAPTCRGEEHPCTHFCRALSIHKENSIKPYGNHGKSEVAASFSLFSETKECKTQEDWENIKSDQWSLKNQCFLVAERVLPEEIKDSYIFRRVFEHGLDGVMFHKGRNQETLSQCSQICRESIQLELESKLELGSVLVYLMTGIRYGGELEDEEVDECYKLLDLCLQVFSKDSQDLKLDVKLVDEVGDLLFDFALVFDSAKSKKMFEPLLQFGEGMVRVIRMQIGEKSCVSISHRILERVKELYWGFSEDRVKKDEYRRRQLKENRMRRLILRMMRCEDATQIDSNGNSMLHSLLCLDGHARHQFTKEIALILIRNGCDIEARDADGLTVKENICNSRRYEFDPDAPENEELMTLLSPPRTTLPLQEIAARTILRCKIPHEGIVPRHLSVLLTGEVEYSDSELYLSPSDCESSASEQGEWGYSSPDGSVSDGVMSD
ncbi:uncharacterized protein LOC115919311 [Strongylocentrotus purpuratus]|uniref:Uncharacterized protein n=1 Tax=Strongylocentrotus purpuratus TaxID=7668 RepID=A0A7M7MZ43_STRPU|nr:uncharacterized protein LOC115919311 [Strongylocentrotus purpuratus]